MNLNVKCVLFPDRSNETRSVQNCLLLLKLYLPRLMPQRIKSLLQDRPAQGRQQPHSDIIKVLIENEITVL